jgi:gluconokinase
MVIVVMGVAGSGKSTVGSLLAESLSAEFIEGDDYHDAQAIAKMSRGTPLTESDRQPWLARLRAEIDARLADGRPAVVACSALSDASRTALGTDRPGVRLVHLTGDPALIAARLAERAANGAHFMPAALLESQLRALELPDGAIEVNISSPPAEIVSAIRDALDD